MDIAHTTTRKTASIHFSDWQARFQMAGDVDQLMRCVRDYLAAWSPDQLGRLPCDVAATALASTDDLLVRAMLASRAELKFEGPEDDHEVLREMALTLASATMRLRCIRAMKSRAPS